MHQRRLPGWSVIGVIQTLAVHMIAAVVDVPVSSTSATACCARLRRHCPVGAATTPAISLASMPTVLLPTKLTLIVSGSGGGGGGGGAAPTGTISSAVTGARRVPAPGSGVAVSVKSPPVTVNFR